MIEKQEIELQYAKQIIKMHDLWFKTLFEPIEQTFEKDKTTKSTFDYYFMAIILILVAFNSVSYYLISLIKC